MAMQAVSPAKPTTAPLFATGPYALYPLHVCSADAIAKLFVKICARGNPILQGKSAADLYQLGLAFYKKSLGGSISMVFLKDGVEPVALQFGWDIFDGGVWKGTSGPPEGMACHAAIGQHIFASLPHESVQGEDMFMAFFGVAPPHPGKVLMHAMQVMAVLTSSDAGFTRLLGYAVHASTIEQQQAYTDNDCGTRSVWRVNYADIKVADEKTQEELCSIAESAGMAECSLTDLSWLLEDIRTDHREYVREFADELRKGLPHMRAVSHMQFDDHGVQMPMASL